jgi:outer membrane immunogenic protein
MKMRVVAALAAASVMPTYFASAFAADLGASAPIYTKAPPIVPFSWTGIYAGVTAGYGWTGDDVNTMGTVIGDGNANKNNVNAASDATALHFNTNPNGFLLGDTLGYNFQTGRFVLGVETDFSWADIKGSGSQGVTTISKSGDIFASSGTAEQKIDAFGTLRARLGVTPIDRLLIYGTGGLAYGDVESNSNIGVVSPISGPNFSNAIGSASSWRAGWTAGAGVEFAFAEHWSAKAEYLYYDLGDLNYNSTLTSTAATPATIGVASTADFKGNIVRAGVNYKFW